MTRARLELREKAPIIGKHVYGNLYGCDAKLLSDVKLMRRIIREAVDIAKMRLVEMKSWKFGGDNGGLSVMALVMESHIAVHTWPKYAYATIDVYTCGDKSDPHTAFEHICQGLKPERVVKHFADRSSIA